MTEVSNNADNAFAPNLSIRAIAMALGPAIAAAAPNVNNLRRSIQYSSALPDITLGRKFLCMIVFGKVILSSSQRDSAIRAGYKTRVTVLLNEDEPLHEMIGASLVLLCYKRNKFM